MSIVTVLIFVVVFFTAACGLYAIFHDNTPRPAPEPEPFKDEATPGMVKIVNSSINICWGPPEPDESQEFSGIPVPETPDIQVPSSPLDDLYEGNLPEDTVRLLLSSLIDSGMTFTFGGRVLSKEDIPGLDVSSFLSRLVSQSSGASSREGDNPDSDLSGAGSRDGGQSDEQPYGAPGTPAGADRDFPENHFVELSPSFEESSLPPEKEDGNLQPGQAGGNASSASEAEEGGTPQGDNPPSSPEPPMKEDAASSPFEFTLNAKRMDEMRAMFGKWKASGGKSGN